MLVVPGSPRLNSAAAAVLLRILLKAANHEGLDMLDPRRGEDRWVGSIG
jgi:hypothetical protein